MTTTSPPRRPTHPPERPRRSGNRPSSAFQVLVAGLVCFLVASLLNAQHLHRMAEDLPTSSDVRKPAMTVTGWLKSLSGAFQLTRPGRAIDERRPGGAGFAEAGLDGAAATDTTAADGTGDATAAADPNATTVVGDPNATTVPADGTAASAGDPTVPTLPAGPKVPTKADKALLYIAGDSLGKDLAIPLQALSEDTGVVRTAVRAEVGTGLVRPDRYNWPAQLKADMASLKPDVVVVEFGGNDTQGIPMPGGQDIQSVLDPKWAVEYARRVGATMDLLNAENRKLVWVGVPNNRDDAKTAELAVIRQVCQNEAARRGIAYVDTWALFESPEGNYADYIVVDGDLKQVRKTDGFHLNTDGVNYLARNVLDVIIAELKARGAAI